MSRLTTAVAPYAEAWRVDRRLRASTVLAGAGAVAALATPFGLHPGLMMAGVAAAWLVTLAPRWGLGAAVALVVVGWSSINYLAVLMAPWFSIPLPVAVSMGFGSAAVLAVVTARAPLPAPMPERLSTWTVAASLSGGVAWIAGVLLGLFLPGGGGLSWAVWHDSSLDLWVVRRFLDHGGIVGSNPRPFEHAQSTALVPAGLTLDASAETFYVQIQAHAIHWSVLIVAATTLAGLLVAEFTRGNERRRWIAPIAAAAVSLGLLAAPVSGRFMTLGQINAHLVIVFCLAALHIALRASRGPIEATAMLAMATTLLMLTWTPYAAVPGVLMLATAAQSHRRIRADPTRALAWLGASGIVWLLSAQLFFFDQLQGVTHVLTSADEQGFTTTTEQLSVVSAPVTIALGVTVAVLAAVVWPKATHVALTASLALLGLAVAFLPLVVDRGTLSDINLDDEYYPMRFLAMTSAVLVVVSIALAAKAAAQSWTGAAASCVTLGVAAGLALIATLPAGVERFGYTPFDIATGQTYGTRAEVIDKVANYGSNSEVRIAWRADPPYDFWVNWMLSVNSNESPIATWGSPLRAQLHIHRFDTEVDRICAIDEATDLPVILVTRDEGLEAEIQAACPSETVTVGLLP